MSSTKRVIFSPEDDLLLLRDVLHYNPFLVPDEWILITSRMSQEGKKFSVRGVKDRLQYLLGQFKKDDGLNRRRSGTEEQISEMTQLLQEIVDLQREFGGVKRSRSTAVLGVDARNDAALLSAYDLIEEITIDPSPPDSFPHPMSSPTPRLLSPGNSINQMRPTSAIQIPKRSPGPIASSSPILSPPSLELLSPPSKLNCTKIQRKNANYLQHVQERQSKEREIEVRKLDIEEKKLEMEKEKLELEKKKFEFECEMKRKEQEMQLKEREARLDNDKIQMRIMATLAEHVSKLAPK